MVISEEKLKDVLGKPANGKNFTAIEVAEYCKIVEAEEAKKAPVKKS